MAEKFHRHSFPSGKWFHLDECNSTQLYFKTLIENGEDEKLNLFALSTDKQINGIGRGNHQWEHQTGGVALSLKLPVTFAPTLAPLHFANILWEFLVEGQMVHGTSLKLKWPNDLYVLNDQQVWKKLAGVITHHINGNFLFGLGLNLYSNPQYGHLKSETPNTSTTLNFIEAMLHFFSIRWGKEIFSSTNWLERCIHLQKNVELIFSETEKVQGIFTGIGNIGECLIDHRPYVAGSLTWKL
jgi:biotin-(acetyl-CoA carboxylase) ligase